MLSDPYKGYIELFLKKRSPPNKMLLNSIGRCGRTVKII